LQAQPDGPFVEDGIDALRLLTPLVEKWRKILGWSIVIALVVAGIAALAPRKYKAEVTLTPVVSNKSSSALGGIAALAGATLSTGYQLTPARMVELLKSRTVLAGVGKSRARPSGQETIIDRFLGKHYDNNDDEEIQNHLTKIIDVGTNKETGTITLTVQHKDSGLARIIASRVVDSASQIFVRTSKAQAQQLRMAQDNRVQLAKSDLAAAEERLREFRFANRSISPFSVASVDQQRLSSDVTLAEQVYTQAITDQQSAYAHELEETPTVVVQDPLPMNLPKVRKRIIIKTAIAGIVSFVVLCLGVLLFDLTRRRLNRSDPESDRFRRAVSGLPLLRRRAARA
jgi:capsule polysaccharide export protein KpsE/RkpR